MYHLICFSTLLNLSLDKRRFNWNDMISCSPRVVSYCVSYTFQGFANCQMGDCSDTRENYWCQSKWISDFKTMSYSASLFSFSFKFYSFFIFNILPALPFCFTSTSPSLPQIHYSSIFLQKKADLPEITIAQDITSYNKTWYKLSY